MKKLKFICIAHGETAVCLVYDDGSFINIGHVFRDDGTTADVVNKEMVGSQHEHFQRKSFWTQSWPTVIEV